MNLITLIKSIIYKPIWCVECSICLVYRMLLSFKFRNEPSIFGIFNSSIYHFSSSTSLKFLDGVLHAGFIKNPAVSQSSICSKEMTPVCTFTNMTGQRSCISNQMTFPCTDLTKCIQHNVVVVPSISSYVFRFFSITLQMLTLYMIPQFSQHPVSLEIFPVFDSLSSHIFSLVFARLPYGT